ncbi:ribosomal oxygenase 1 [Palaemon carinicauda]|uniref:ribosomal oxygenase 1 n=1 Tax=Palaemon carinicauda TaxID=392227 RepID=UPI0035B68CB8
MKVSNKPLTAFEVYAKGKVPEVTKNPAIVSRNKIKKLKRKKLIETKKLKKAGISITEDSDPKSTSVVVVRSGAVKPVKKKKTLPIENGVNGLNVKKKKPKKKKALAPDNENESTNEKVTKTLKEKKVKKLNKEKSNNVKKPKSVKTEKQADLKKKIAEVRKLVKKKAVESKDTSSENDEDEDEDALVESNEWEESDDEMECVIEAFTGEELDAVNCGDSRKVGQETFQWIIKPYSEEEFFKKFWETAPLIVKRNKKDYYKGLFSTEDFDKILHEQVVLYSKNLDITSYTDGKRETHNPIGQAHPPVVWDYYNNGCSIRMLNPQTFHPRVWKCLASLQEYFNSFCGANVYLTPPDTQGFAPHWDDIEAFILQLEGRKRWKVYAPRNDDEVLPDYSSPNLTDKIIGKPILDTILEPGDLLYFPRGYIHQGHAVENEHSLHITLSTYQKNSWGHYLEKLLPQALNLAMSEDVEFRRGIPRQYLDYMGIVHMDRHPEEREGFKKKVCDLVMRMMENAPFDACVDQRGASFIHDCLPPYLTPEDKQCSAYGGGERWCPKTKTAINRVELLPDTLIRLIRGNCIRLVAEEADKVHIYHCLENSREYHKEEPQFLEITPEVAPAVEALIHTYPSYIAIESLPLATEEEKMAIASGLWERGLLVSAHPLDSPHED